MVDDERRRRKRRKLDTDAQIGEKRHSQRATAHDGDASSTASSSEVLLEPTLEELEYEQHMNQSRFRNRMEDIFQRYSMDFSETADEIDIRTGRVVVDRGHWMSLPDVQESDSGEESDFSSDEDGILDDHDEDILDFLAHPAPKDAPAWLSNSRASPAPFGQSGFLGANSKLQYPVKPLSMALEVPPDDVVLQQFGTAGPAVLDLLKRRAEEERRASSSPAPALRPVKEEQWILDDEEDEEEDDLSCFAPSPNHRFISPALLQQNPQLSTAKIAVNCTKESNAERGSLQNNARDRPVFQEVASAKEAVSLSSMRARQVPSSPLSRIEQPSTVFKTPKPILKATRPCSVPVKTVHSASSRLRKHALTQSQRLVASSPLIKELSRTKIALPLASASPSSPKIAPPKQLISSSPLHVPAHQPVCKTPLAESSARKLLNSNHGRQRGSIQKELAEPRQGISTSPQKSPSSSETDRALRPRQHVLYNDKLLARPTTSEARQATPIQVRKVPLYINLADEDDDLAVSSPLHTLNISTPDTRRREMLYSAAKTEPIDYNPFDLMDEEDEISGLMATPARPTVSEDTHFNNFRDSGSPSVAKILEVQDSEASSFLSSLPTSSQSSGAAHIDAAHGTHDLLDERVCVKTVNPMLLQASPLMP
jgi:hypothetical protein